jgi:hypothetical protein
MANNYETCVVYNGEKNKVSVSSTIPDNYRGNYLQVSGPRKNIVSHTSDLLEGIVTLITAEPVLDKEGFELKRRSAVPKVVAWDTIGPTGFDLVDKS